MINAQVNEKSITIFSDLQTLDNKCTSKRTYSCGYNLSSLYYISKADPTVGKERLTTQSTIARFLRVDQIYNRKCLAHAGKFNEPS